VCGDQARKELATRTILRLMEFSLKYGGNTEAGGDRPCSMIYLFRGLFYAMWSGNPLGWSDGWVERHKGTYVLDGRSQMRTRRSVSSSCSGLLTQSL